MSTRHALTIPQVLLVAALLVGCSSTKTIEVHDDYREINEKGAQKRGRVLLDTGVAFGAEGLRIDADSASFIVFEEYILNRMGAWISTSKPKTPYVKNVATSQISEVRFKSRNHGAGAQRGAAYGVGLGVLGGLVAADDDNCDALCGYDPWAVAAIGAVVNGTLGSLIGAAVGLTDTHVYHIVEDETSPQKSGSNKPQVCRPDATGKMHCVDAQ